MILKYSEELVVFNEIFDVYSWDLLKVTPKCDLILCLDEYTSGVARITS